MTRRVPFYLVDVFAEAPLTGNPLAVVADCGALDDATMARVAREFNQAETTFVVAPTRAGADWRLRSFTAAGIEVFGAGHNSLGAWWWLAESGRLAAGVSSFTQEMGTRLLPVEVVREAGRPVSVGLTQAAPVFGAEVKDGTALAAALGVESIGGVARVVSTGAAHLLTPMKDRAAIACARPDAGRLAAILRSVAAQGCYLYSLDPMDRTAVAHTRFFNPVEGIAEDAATGSAAGPLACLLVKQGVVQDGAAVKIEQGYAMDRPSLIEVRVSGDEVRVSGRCVTVAEGWLMV